MKLYDFDGMFDEKLSSYMQNNRDKYTAEEWEERIPRLYDKFGDTFIKSVGNTPNGYYAALSDEQLVKSLSAHVRQGVPVNKFLLNAVGGRDLVNLLLPLLGKSPEEALYAVRLIGASPAASSAYLRLLAATDNVELQGALLENLKDCADLVKEEALEYCGKGVCREYMLEILSRCVLHDDRIFDILIRELRTADENLPAVADLAAAYGDERAIPYLTDRIEQDSVTYVEYRELKYAIEALGGSYETDRDFSSDPNYELINAHNTADVDIFKDVK